MALRGRAASPIRVGFIIKNTLQGNIPLKTGELVSEAAIADIFGAYKGEVDRVNTLRSRDRRIRGMIWSSFYTAFRFAKIIGLVEFVREEPMLYPPPGGDLVRIEKGGNGHKIVKSTRKVFRLTSIGMTDEKSWSDLTRAYKEGWAPGQAMPYAAPAPAPTAAPVKERVKKPKVQPVGFQRYLWDETPSLAKFRTLLTHINNLKELGIEYSGVTQEATRLSMAVGDWMMYSEESLEEAQSINAPALVKKFQARLKLMTGLSDALGIGNLDESIEILQTIIKEEEKHA